MARRAVNGTLMLHRRLLREYEIRPASSGSRTWWAATANLVRRLTGTATRSWLAEQLAVVDTELADLATTRNTLLRLAGTTDAGPPADATMASPAYQQILAVFATTDHSGLRAKEPICSQIRLIERTVEWPQTLAAMCGGSPERMASVTKILRKSWGRHCRGWPAAMIWAAFDMATRHSRM